MNIWLNTGSIGGLVCRSLYFVLINKVIINISIWIQFKIQNCVVVIEHCSRHATQKQHISSIVEVCCWFAPESQQVITELWASVTQRMADVREQMRGQTLYHCLGRSSQEVGDDISVCYALLLSSVLSPKQLSKQGLTGVKSMGK